MFPNAIDLFRVLRDLRQFERMLRLSHILEQFCFWRLKNTTLEPIILDKRDIFIISFASIVVWSPGEVIRLAHRLSRFVHEREIKFCEI